MSNIIIPPKLNVGFQNRDDTYTGKLAYVIYFDEKGKLHKEPSWNGWRDEKIPNEIYENEPLEGFVLNKKVGGYKSHWDFRQTYARVYDPRGFEFEITVENLLWILENNNCIKGKGLEGEYIYGWSGGDLLLIPISSPDYQEISKKNLIRKNNEFIKGKDLVIGATYKSIDDRLYVYLGRYRYYDTKHVSELTDIPEGYIGALDNLYFYFQNGKNNTGYYFYKDFGLQYYFAEVDNDRLKVGIWYTPIYHWRSLPKKFIECVDLSCHHDYKEFFETEVESKDFFSPIDVSKNEIIPFTFEQFDHDVDVWFHSNNHWSYWGKSIYYFKDGNFHSGKILYDTKRDAYHLSRDTYYHGRLSEYLSVSDIYETFKPCYGIQYLMNGKEYRKIGIENG